MPTYEYECNKCGHRFDKFQKMSDEPEKKCPECGAKVKRGVGGGGAVIFKGSGFYATDYRRSDAVATRCGRSNTCCGRDVPCDSPPCSE